MKRRAKSKTVKFKIRRRRSIILTVMTANTY